VVGNLQEAFASKITGARRNKNKLKINSYSLTEVLQPFLIEVLSHSYLIL